MWLFMAVACLILQATDSQESLSRRHLNPEEFMTISEIIQYWGYPSEEYQVLTEDGYFLQVNRISYGVHSPGKTGPRPVVLLVHGLLYEGRTWIANVPSNSLGFFLADAGYDVWILNCRGTTWSRRHQTLSIDQEQFWNFSFHELGIYDVPAAIHFILEKTQQDGLYYIGHSQGASVGLIAFSVMPQLGEKVKLFMCLAPAYTLVDLRGKFLPLVLAPQGLIRLIFGKKEFCLFSNKLKAMFAKLCSYAIIDKICLQTNDVYRKEDLNVSRADVYIGIYPDFTSVKTIIHWNQVWKSHEFKYFDYGCKNKEMYNMSTPPFYKIEDIIVPTAVWSGGKDRTVTTRDTERLLPRIKPLVFYKEIPYWDHQDFIWGLDAPENLFSDVLCLMEKYK
ncbi:lipase member M-like [Tiliqua scincoides]|uniref:lipase member M-like n=1 Tax=Tiliqua scincoides TaxID=71010 RepID=UPI0034620CB2